MPGQVLIFPATLVHWVHPNDSDDDRVTIAFNGHFRRRQPARGGKKVSFSLARVETLFPILLFRYRVEEAGLNEKLAVEIARRRKSEGGKVNTGRLGWQSEHDFFMRQEAGHATLARADRPDHERNLAVDRPNGRFHRRCRSP